MKVVAIIPARYQSERLPGKPLLPIRGVPLIKRVYDNSQKFRSVYTTMIATDDIRIQEYCFNAGIPVIMTSKDHESGSSRIFEASQGLDFDYLLNIQGDEPFINPDDIDGMIKAAIESNWSITTLAAQVQRSEDIKDPNVVKVTLNHRSEAMYFSRSSIPYQRSQTASPILQHTGVYLFSKAVIKQLQNLQTSTIADTEKLEQLNWMFFGFPIGVFVGTAPTLGIDTLEDVKAAEDMLRSRENKGKR